MDSASLTHDAAWAMAREIVAIFAGCLREEELHDAVVEVYAQVKVRLEELEERRNRLRQRMRPGLN